jgi:hypothetical protein
VRAEKAFLSAEPPDRKRARDFDTLIVSVQNNLHTAMPDPSTLRDSTQIVLSSDALAGLRAELDERFTLTFLELNDRREGESECEGGGEYVRIIGSPVEIRAASEFLSRHGVTLR